MSCERCAATPGWVVTEREGYSGVERCPCSAPAVQESRKASTREILDMIAKIAAAKVIPFFPETKEAMVMLAAECSNFVSDTAALDRFMRALLRYAKKYEGPAWLRLIYCAKVGDPADGIRPDYKDMVAAGFSLEVCEFNAKAAELEERELKLTEYQKLGAGQELFLLPEAKRIA